MSSNVRVRASCRPFLDDFGDLRHYPKKQRLHHDRLFFSPAAQYEIGLAQRELSGVPGGTVSSSEMDKLRNSLEIKY